MRQALGDDPQQPAVRADGPPPRLPLRGTGGGRVGGGPARCRWRRPRLARSPVARARAPAVLPWAVAALARRGRLGVRDAAGGAVAARPTRFTIPLPAVDPLPAKAPASLALSPDGRLLAYTAGRGEKSQLYLRPLDRFDAAPVRGHGGRGVTLLLAGRALGRLLRRRPPEEGAGRAAGRPSTSARRASRSARAGVTTATIVFAPTYRERADGPARRTAAPRRRSRIPTWRRARSRTCGPRCCRAGRRSCSRSSRSGGLGQARLAAADLRSGAAARPFGAGHVRPVRADRASRLRARPTASWRRRSTRARSRLTGPRAPGSRRRGGLRAHRACRTSRCRGRERSPTCPATGAFRSRRWPGSGAGEPAAWPTASRPFMNADLAPDGRTPP